MFGLFKKSRRQSRLVAARAVGAVCESLESRQMLSAPPGYLQVADYSVDSRTHRTTSPLVISFQLESGRSYLLEARGTHQLAYDGRLADAQTYQPTTTTWNLTAGPHLHVNGVSTWGAFRSDHIYGKEITGDGSNLVAWISDSNYADNDGSLSLEVYAENLTLTMDAPPITVGYTREATISLKGANDRPIANTLLTISASNSNVQVETTTVTTDANGNATIELTGVAEGNVDVLVQPPFGPVLAAPAQAKSPRIRVGNQTVVVGGGLADYVFLEENVGIVAGAEIWNPIPNVALQVTADNVNNQAIVAVGARDPQKPTQRAKRFLGSRGLLSDKPT